MSMGLTFTEHDPALMLRMWLWPYERDASILLLLPIMLRQVSLIVIDSHSHDDGDVPENSDYYQIQI
eukprot:EW709040.1.p2 GENE.EW709040.1~~EW709040.1.p2  ORF type:complete len:67 (+),score=12.42 EW709040.1:192-392(+)